VAVLKTGAWPWLIVAAVLIVVGLLVVEGAAGTIILACGFLALLGAGIRLISRNDPALGSRAACLPVIPASDHCYARY
jgi:hypothetical protein